MAPQNSAYTAFSYAEGIVSSSKLVIDFLDLSLRLGPSSLSSVESLLTIFEAEHIHIEVSPKIKGATLHINSNDLIALMGYIQEGLFSEIELRAFKKEAIFQLDQQLIRTTGLDARSHYRWCIAAVKNFKVGRFVLSPE